MAVIFEFLGNEPIENVVTCMNYKVDKVVFFGYHEVIKSQRPSAERFLIDFCGVKSVVFHPLSHDNLQSIISTMRKEIEYELSKDTEIYFDITGGESLILVAFGMLAKEFETPMHLYDIENDRLIELDEGAKRCISDRVKKQKTKLTLDWFIEMRGAIINYDLRKDIKDSMDPKFEQDADKIWDVAKQFLDLWNPFSDFLKKNMTPDGNLSVRRNSKTVIKALSSSKNKLKTVKDLNQIIDALGDAGVLLDIVHANGKYSFRFKNERIKNCLWEGGSILELHTYHYEMSNSDDCQVGVHLDWDGIVNSKSGDDVTNEIDVLSLRGYVPTFISCKSGNLDQHQILHALYELDTVTRRFGGRYAKKVLVTVEDIGDVHLKRALEMGIEVRNAGVFVK